MNDENKMLEWIPDVEEYNPNISKEKWLELIGNRSVFDENALVAFACIKNANVATCSDMAEEFGRVKNFYNNNVWQTGKKVHLETNCQLSERDGDDNRFWSVCCLGRYLENGKFEYKIRPELEDAFEEIGILNNVNLYNNMVDKEQEFRKWMSVQKYNDDKDYKAGTINDYCRALKNAPKSLNIEDRHKRSVFTYDDYSSYIDVVHVIRKASNFEEINRRYASGAFNAAMNLYEIFLKDDSHNYSKNQKNMNISNNNSNKYQKYIDILEANKNLILTGAPGTGKTFLAKQIAARIIYGDNVPEEFENDIAFETQCKLVQFHPSYDYTDFVEGLRPVEKDGNIGFERKDGVFKEFCIRAIKNNDDNSIESVSGNESEGRCNSILPLDSVSNSVSDNEFERRYNQLLHDIKSKKYEAYSTDRAYYPVSIENDDIRFKQPSGKFKKAQKDYVKMIFCDNEFQGKTSSDIEKMKRDEIENIFKKNNKRNYTESLDYTLYRWVLMKIAEYKIENQNNIDVSESSIISKKYIFIIDEINRGEISKIFGELFYCIDPGYRGPQGRISTQYQNLVPKGDVFEPAFYVPDNVYIIGTMNDIDRSVESMDFAFRRRFAFMEVKADENLEMLYEVLDENLADKSKLRLLNLNKKISEMEDEGLSSAYHIGASYFLKIKDYNGDFEKLWNYHLIGLLREYLRGMSNIEAKIESLKAAYDNESASNN